MARYKLGEICEIVSGSTPKTDVAEYWDGTEKWITPAELNDESYIIYDSVRKLTELGVKKTGLTPFPEGTVILSSRAPIGKVAIAGCEMCCNQGFKNLICSDIINNRYLYWFLKGNTAYLNSLGRGATFKEISKQIVASIEINVPSQAEQLAAVEQLEKVTDVIRLRRAQLQKLDELVKARFVELFGDPELNPRGLPVLPWNAVFLTTTGKLDSNAMVENGRYPFFTCAKESYKIDSYAFDCEALLLAGNNAAGIYDVKHYKGKFNAYQRTYVLRLMNEKWSYILFKRQLEDKLQYLQSQSKGTNTRYLTLGILNELRFVVPPVAEQEQFAVFVEQTDKSKLAIQQSLDKLKTLRKSLMQEYYGQGE